MCRYQKANIRFLLVFSPPVLYFLPCVSRFTDEKKLEPNPGECGWEDFPPPRYGRYSNYRHAARPHVLLGSQAREI